MGPAPSSFWIARTAGSPPKRARTPPPCPAPSTIRRTRKPTARRRDGRKRASPDENSLDLLFRLTSRKSRPTLRRGVPGSRGGACRCHGQGNALSCSSLPNVSRAEPSRMGPEGSRQVPGAVRHPGHAVADRTGPRLVLRTFHQPAANPTSPHSAQLSSRGRGAACQWDHDQDIAESCSRHVAGGVAGRRARVAGRSPSAAGRW